MTRSNIVELLHRQTIGRRSLTLESLKVLGIGVMRVFFHDAGKVADFIEELKMSVSGEMAVGHEMASWRTDISSRP